MGALGGENVRGRIIALRDPLQRDVVTGLGANVEEREPGRAELGELGVALREDVACHCVARHAAQARKCTARSFEDRAPVLHRQHERVAVGDEDLLDLVTVHAPRGVEVLERRREVAHAERLVPVHVAVRTMIPGAADRRLDDVRVGLGRRAIELSLVAHRSVYGTCVRAYHFATSSSLTSQSRFATDASRASREGVFGLLFEK